MATTDKYDRQLRLWGAHGQRALMAANILLVHADAAGTETLKNLVLPGVGRFSVLDDAVVGDGDLGSNFFVHPSDRGRPRAQACVAALAELNADCVGTALVMPPAAFDFPAALSTFSLVVLSNADDRLTLQVARLCWERRVPLVSIASCGFICCYGVQLRDHAIIESKIEQSQKGLELSLAKPFPELLSFSSKFELDSLDFTSHSHVPYVVILLQAVERWRAEHGGQAPRSFAEKDAFRARVRAQAKDLDNEPNFQEAVEKSFQAYAEEAVSEELLRVLAAARAPPSVNTPPAPEDGSRLSDSQEFLLLVRALDIYLLETGGQAPLSGVLPDLTSSTEHFISLQGLYAAKALADRLRFTQILRGLLPGPLVQVDDERVELFCRNARNVRLLHTRSFEELIAGVPSPALKEALYDPFADPLQTPALWYLGLRAVERFRTRHGRWPGSGPAKSPAQVESDVDELWALLQAVAGEQEVPVLGGGDMMETEETAAYAGRVCGVSRAHAAELARYGDTQLHAVAAFAGGVAAQEVVKVLTRQFVPLQSHFLYNGIASCGGTYYL